MAKKSKFIKSKFAAIVISIIFHLAILTGFAAMKFGRLSAVEPNTRTPEVTIQPGLQKSESMHKPKIKKITSLSSDASILSSAIDDKAFELPVDTEFFKKPQSDYTDPSLSQLDPSQINFSRTNFFGHKTDNPNLVFLIDATGSMKGLLPAVKQNLEKTISNLSPGQYFNLHFFTAGNVISFSDLKPVRASAGAKKTAVEFIRGIKPAGQSDALNALKQTLQKSADNKSLAVFLLTDGFELNRSPRTAIRNIERLINTFTFDVTINTIAFWPRKTDTEILQALSEMTAGRFTVFDDENYQ